MLDGCSALRLADWMNQAPDAGLVCEAAGSPDHNGMLHPAPHEDARTAWDNEQSMGLHPVYAAVEPPESGARTGRLGWSVTDYMGLRNRAARTACAAYRFRRDRAVGAPQRFHPSTPIRRVNLLEYKFIEPGDILRLKPSGALTTEDFSGLTRFVDAYLDKHGSLAGLLIETQSFPGWDSFAGFASHLRFIRDHQRHVKRIALVTDSSIAHIAETLAEPFAAAEIRCFAFDHYDGALQWLKGEPRASENILVVLTSHAELGNTGRKTGFWLEELAAPYYVLTDAGAKLTLASPKGGQPPLDPASDVPGAATTATQRFKSDPAAQALLANTRRLHDISPGEFDAVFYPGGHGPLWDLAEDPDSIALIKATVAARKPLAAVCHAPGVLRHVQSAQGEALVKGRKVTGFSNTEELAAGLAEVVPFSVEDMLIAEGGLYSKAPDWQVHVMTDDLLITGQNPASSGPTAEALLARLRNER